MIGNDLVDLTDPETSLGQVHPRFMKRVFSQSELRSIGESDDPRSALWIHWAAKESAFKAVKKGKPELVFRHQDFVARLQTISPAGTSGIVSCGVEPIAVVVARLDHWVHAVALRKVARHAKESRVEGVGRLETDQDPSRAVRRFAIDVLARLLEHPADLLAITDERPPRLLAEDLSANVDLSLAHHGDGIAFAAVISEGSPFLGRRRTES